MRVLVAMAAVAACLGSCLPSSSKKKVKASVPVEDPFYVENKEIAAAFLESEHVHKPVRERKCTGCHLAAEPGKKIAEEPDLCFICHADLKKEGEKEHVHMPFAGGACSGCHEIHSSDNPKLLNAKVNELCGMCHEPAEDPIKTGHGGIVVAKALCTECHSPHASSVKKIIWETNLHMPFEGGMCDSCHGAKDGKVKLAGDGSEICLTCHTDLEELRKKENVHYPFAAGECWACHSPHRGRYRAMLRDRPSALCAACHEGIPLRGHPIVKHPSENPGKRNPLDKEEPFDCSSCHDPHASDIGRYFPVEPGELCQSCHGGA